MGGGGKGGGGGSRAHDYYGTIAGVVCTGVVDALVAIVLDGKEVWPNAKPWAVGQVIALNELRSWGGRNWKCILAHTAVANNRPPNPTYWTQYVLARGATISATLTVEGFGQFFIYWGTDAQTAHPRLQAAGNEFGEQHPDYKGLCYVVLQDFLFGRERGSAPNLEVIVQRKALQSVITGSPADLVDGQASMLAATAELLTHSNGLQLAAASLNSTSFQTAANDLHARHELTACSPLFDEQSTVRNYFAELAQLTDTFLRFNPATRLIEAGAYVRGTIPGTYHVLTNDDLTDKPRFKADGWSTVKTRAVVQFNDRIRSYKQTTDKADDLRAFRVLGEHRPLTLQRTFISRRSQAIQHAAETLRTLGRPQLRGTITVRREKARPIRPGDYVQLDIDLEPGGTQLLQFFRVIDRSIPPKGPISFSVEADETLAANAANAEDNSDADLVTSVPELANARIIEAPVALAGHEPDHILVLAERPDGQIAGFQVFFDADFNGVYQHIGDTRGFATRATLRANFSSTEAGALQISVPAQVDGDTLSDSVSALKAKDDQLLVILVKIAAGQVAEDANDYSEIEVCSISAISLVSAGNYDLTVLRGRRTTQQRSFTTADTEVWIIQRSMLDAFHHSDFEEIRRNRIKGVSPSTGFFRLTTYTQFETRDLADCTAREFRFARNSAAGPQLVLTTPTTNAVQWPINWAVGQVIALNEYRWQPSNNTAYKCKLAHTAAASNEPGVGASWATYWDTATPYPVDIQFAGSWTDPNNDMTAFQMFVEKDGVAGEILDEDETFSPIGTYSFDERIHIAESGVYRIRIVARDATGLKSDRTITITALGSSLKVAKPKFKWRGKKVSGEEWNLYGQIKLTCRTPGATIEFRYVNVNDATSATIWTGPWHTYDEDGGSPTEYPVGWQPTDNIRQLIEARATKTGYTMSDTNTLTIKFKRVNNTDPAF